MIRGYISNPKQLSKEMQLRIASMAEKQVRIAELGFPLNEKNWCKLTPVSYTHLRAHET